MGFSVKVKRIEKTMERTINAIGNYGGSTVGIYSSTEMFMNIP